MTNVIPVNTWEECEREILNIEKANSSAIVGVWFRGQPDSRWGLTTTLERRMARTWSVADYYNLIGTIKPEIETFTGSTWEEVADIRGLTSDSIRSYRSFQKLLWQAYTASIAD